MNGQWILVKQLGELSFRSLMDVYAGENLQTGKQNWPRETADRQLALAEQEFYQFLRQVFFRTEGACYAIWAEAGRYKSALRMEPYRDGFLLSGLETAPDQRGKGYASALMMAVLHQAEGVLYSHVDKHNTASLRVHEKCGFRKAQDFAVLLDGSVTRRSWTLVFDSGKKKVRQCAELLL